MMKIIYNNLIPIKSFLAINLFGVVFARKEHKPLSDKTINHEKIHTYQMKEMLYVFFYLWYVVEWLIKLTIYGKQSYNNLSFEREAKKNESDSKYLGTRKHFAWFNFLIK